MKKLIQWLRKKSRDKRGSALLVSLMVIVGLSLLGLGFVAISETESAIAKNQQTALQTQAIAESGARVVAEWFQDPTWAETNAGMPRNSAVGNLVIPAAGAIKTMRNITGYSGTYKPRYTTTKLCDKPFRPNNEDRFFGDEDHADIIINATTGGQAMLDTFNNILIASDTTAATDLDKMAGEVTEIKIFAPPIVGGTLTNGFWAGGSRYGVATIKVTAQQFRNPQAHTGVIASHAVRIVVGELPLPIPAGPIQGDANVSFGGNFRVHWGMETSQGNLTPSLNLSSLPWANAYERPHFEHGYEPAANAGGGGVASITVTSGGSGYTNGASVTVTGGGGSGATGTIVVIGGVVTSVTMTAQGTGYNPQALVPPFGNCSASCLTVNWPGGGTGAAGVANVAAQAWPVSGGIYDSVDYFHEVLAKDFQDPFYGCRAYGDNMMDGVTPNNSPPFQCYPYAFTLDEQSNVNPSYAFQYQNVNSYPTKKKVVFPTILYPYWKRITQSGRGYRGIYYFTYDTATTNFRKFGQGAPLPVSTWVNTLNTTLNLGAGVYFFDTQNGANPQLYPNSDTVNRNAILTPAISWNSSDFGSAPPSAPAPATFLMQGFVYLNAQSFGTTGQGSNATTVQANFPGEPFRDIGYPRWDTANARWDRSCGESTPGANDGQICRVGVGDGAFTCEDLQTGLPHTDGRCRIAVMQAPSWTSNDAGSVVAHTSPFQLPACGHGCSGGANTYVVKTWKSNPQAIADYGQACTAPPANWDGTLDATSSSVCSEPHEPYLNLVYPDLPADNNGAPYRVVVGWEPPNNQTMRNKQVDSQGNPIACAPPDPDKCTTNGYDLDGALVPLPVILDGILYQEGQWGSEGNAWFYGSVLVQDTINLSSGTADVWFDEKLLKGTWAPPKMPRVIVFSEQTDEQNQ
jgi:hypothetical protein